MTQHADGGEPVAELERGEQGDIVVINELGYKITRVEGFMDYEVDWVLTGSRTPGKDT